MQLIEEFKVKEEKAVKVFILNGDKEILFYRRDNIKGLPFRNYWDLIGGQIEERESEIDALEREVMEEIGCKVDETERIGEVYDSRYRTRIALYKARISFPIEDIELCEGQYARYFKFNEARKLRIPKFFRDFMNMNRELFD